MNVGLRVPGQQGAGAWALLPPANVTTYGDTSDHTSDQTCPETQGDLGDGRGCPAAGQKAAPGLSWGARGLHRPGCLLAGGRMQVKQVTWVELALVCKTWCLGVSGRVPGLSWACVAAGAAPAAGGKVCAGVLRQAAGGRSGVMDQEAAFLC